MRKCCGYDVYSGDRLVISAHETAVLSWTAGAALMPEHCPIRGNFPRLKSLYSLRLASK